MRKYLALATVAFFGVAQADDKARDNKPFDDATFVRKASSGCQAMIEIGKIAQQKGQSEAVRKFGERLVTDHTKGAEEFKTWAKANNMDVATKPDDECQKCVDKFKDYKGTNFDADFAKDMVEGHQKSIEMFERASKEAKNAELRQWATKAIPTLREHLEAAKKLQS